MELVALITLLGEFLACRRKLKTSEETYNVRGNHPLHRMMAPGFEPRASEAAGVQCSPMQLRQPVVIPVTDIFTFRYVLL